MELGSPKVDAVVEARRNLSLLRDQKAPEAKKTWLLLPAVPASTPKEGTKLSRDDAVVVVAAAAHVTRALGSRSTRDGTGICQGRTDDAGKTE